MRIEIQILWQSAVLVLISALIALGINQIRPDRLPLVGDWATSGQAVSSDGDGRVIPLDQAQALFENQTAVFLDARPSAAYDQGHIQGALNLPTQAFDRYFPDIVDQLPEDKALIAYCDGPACDLSHDLAEILQEMGYANVRVLVNGWTVWKDQGLPTEGAN